MSYNMKMPICDIPQHLYINTEKPPHEKVKLRISSSPFFIRTFRFCAKVETQQLSLTWPVGGTILVNRGIDWTILQSYSTVQMPRLPYEDRTFLLSRYFVVVFSSTLNFITTTSSPCAKFFPFVKCKDKLAKWLNLILVCDISFFTHYPNPKSIYLSEQLENIWIGFQHFPRH